MDLWITPPALAPNMRLPLPIGAGIFSIGDGGAVVTQGIARNMQRTLPVPLGPGLEPFAQGGGDQNGTSATSILFRNAGCNTGKGSLARLAPCSGNFCGIV